MKNVSKVEDQSGGGNPKGGGFFGFLKNAVRGLIVALGSAVGGPVGGALGLAVASSIDSWWPWGDRGFGDITNRGVSIDPNGIANSKELEAWLKNSFKVWFENAASVLKNSENPEVLKSSNYRNSINKILKDLEYLRVYYNIQKGKSRAVNQIVWNTKEDILKAYRNGLIKAYSESLEALGLTVVQEPLMFVVNKHNLSVPFTENLTWNGETLQTEIMLFTDKLKTTTPIKGESGTAYGPTTGIVTPGENPNNENTPTNNTPTTGTPETVSQNAKKWIKPLAIGGVVLAFIKLIK